MLCRILPISAVALILVLPGYAGAAPPRMTPDNPAFVRTADKQADKDAARYLTSALVMLDRNPHQAFDRIERAETALLNRVSLDLGPQIDISKPLPKTPALDKIDQSHNALAARDVGEARRLAKDALSETKSDIKLL